MELEPVISDISVEGLTTCTWPLNCYINIEGKVGLVLIVISQ